MVWELPAIVAAMALLAVGFARRPHRRAIAEAKRAMDKLASRSPRVAVPTFDPDTLVGNPEIARRYFSHAIRPGTPLRTVVRLSMEGTFRLGDKEGFQLKMNAIQVLVPPSEFVWMPTMKSGPIRISGSDALVAGAAWTRFWINSFVPVVNVSSSFDLVRSALARSAMEAVWAPASLLPSNGVRWEQAGPDLARLHLSTGIEPVDICLDADGRVTEISTMRWSDANPDKIFRLQPFGGVVEAEAEFAGFTIPSRISVGNHFGTENFLPFFQARVTTAEYL